MRKMDDALKRQLDQLLEKAEKSGEKRAIEFLERVENMELPAMEDRYWLLEQFKTVIKDFEEVESDRKIRNNEIILTLFTMGRVWEHYYVPRNKK
jgi:acetyl-CoA carboxylase alpha subunit